MPHGRLAFLSGRCYHDYPERKRYHAPRKEEERDTGGRAGGEGLRGDEPVAALCRKEGIHANVYYTWLKEFMEAGKARLKGEETRGATRGEVEHLQRENEALRLVVADLTVEVRAPKRSLF